jgi:hypothetical protein
LPGRLLADVRELLAQRRVVANSTAQQIDQAAELRVALWLVMNWTSCGTAPSRFVVLMLLLGITILDWRAVRPDSASVARRLHSHSCL